MAGLYERRATSGGYTGYEEGPKILSTIRVAVSNDALTHSYRIPTLRSTAACCSMSSRSFFLLFFCTRLVTRALTRVKSRTAV